MVDRDKAYGVSSKYNGRVWDHDVYAHSTVMKKLLVGYIIKKVGSESENS